MVLSPPATRLNVEKATLDPILRAADRAEPKLRRAIASGLEAIRRAVPDFEDLIAAGNTGPVFTAIQELSVPPKLRAAIADATVTAAVSGAAADAAKFAVSFNDVNQRAVRWAERHAGTLITHVSPQTIAAVRDLVVVGVQNGVHPSITARTIRGVVPLTPRQARSVARLYQSSIEDGVSAAHASKIAARNAKRAQAYRATVIARTEALRAANMGQQLLWDTANDQGLISNATKVWMATGDSRTCVICNEMDGKAVGLGDSYLVPSANPRRAGTTEKTPPAHPQCRCTMVLQYQKVPASPAPTVTGDAPDIRDSSWDILKPDNAPYGPDWTKETVARRTAWMADATDDEKSIMSWVQTWTGSATSGLRDDVSRVVTGAATETPRLKRADLMVRTIRANPHEPPPVLLRGMTFDGASADDVLAMFPRGKNVDWGLSSFSPDAQVANRFAQTLGEGEFGQQGVIVQWAGDTKQALPIQQIATMKEKEWIAGGRFTVKSAERVGDQIFLEVEQIAGL